MNTQNLLDSFQNFKDLKSIDRPTLTKIIQEVFFSVVKKNYGEDSNWDVIVNTDSGDLELYRTRIVVKDGFSEDDNIDIELSKAKILDSDLEVGDEYVEEMHLTDFSRRSVEIAKQTLIIQIGDLEKDKILKKFKDRIGEIVIGEVYQIWKKEFMLLDDEGTEMILPKAESIIPKDFFKKGDTVRAVIKSVEMMGNFPKITLSRTAPEFLDKLFEAEVPEIFDGIIVIKNTVRIPGERSKIAVESYDDRIDPLGACVGMKGSRIHGIVKELRNESIDVINYTDNTSLYIQRALSPAKISSIEIDEENKRAKVFLKPDNVAKAIGRGGNNLNLVKRLTGYDIETIRELEEEEEDVSLEEFSDEIDKWILDEFKNIGCDTAKSVLSYTVEDLVRQTDLEQETIEEIMGILKAEFNE